MRVGLCKACRVNLKPQQSANHTQNAPKMASFWPQDGLILAPQLANLVSWCESWWPRLGPTSQNASKMASCWPYGWRTWYQTRPTCPDTYLVFDKRCAKQVIIAMTIATLHQSLDLMFAKQVSLRKFGCNEASSRCMDNISSWLGRE